MKKKKPRMPRSVQKFINSIMKGNMDPFMKVIMDSMIRESMMRYQAFVEAEEKATQGLSPIEALIRKEVKWLKNQR